MCSSDLWRGTMEVRNVANQPVTTAFPIRDTIRDWKPGTYFVVAWDAAQPLSTEDENRGDGSGMWVIDTDINPAVAGHGGHVKLVEVQDGNVMLEFGGGCHGCSSSSLTLKQGIEVKLREKFPEIGQIVDVTDHSTGANPYYAR